MSTYKIRKASLVQVSPSHGPIHSERKSLPNLFRRKLFLHQDGLILTMVTGALQERAILNMLLDGRSLTVGELVRQTNANRGYLHVALRCLAQEGWLTRSGAPGTDELSYKISQAGLTASTYFPLYVKMAKFLRKHIPFEKSLFINPPDSSLNECAEIINNAAAGWGLKRAIEPPAALEVIDAIGMHLDGSLVIPTLIGLLNLGRLESFPQPFSDGPGLALSLRFFEHLGWIDRKRREWTKEGQTARENALHYGMVGSYFPMLVDLPRMLFDDSAHRTHLLQGEVESHVDRKLNVLACGAAHRKYFMDADEIFIDIFNQEPLSDQPRFIADCGCGDGSWLKHIYNVVAAKTLRGKFLATHPLLMIGVDYNEPALDITRSALEEASVPSLVLFGDITDPGRLAQDLKQRGLDIRSGLHIRAFIDHNRRYGGATREYDYDSAVRSSGAYVDEEGNLIPNRLFEIDLVEFLNRWRPYVIEHGLVLLEAHCVEPRVAARRVGDIHNVVFDTYHGFSHQYPTDFEVFIDAIEKAGLKTALYHQKRYPSRKPFVSISVNRLIVPANRPAIPSSHHSLTRADEWIPHNEMNAGDGEALHRLLYVGGDIDKPRKWCAPGAGILVRSVLKSLNALCDRIRVGKKPPSISIVDYGAGTGLAVIEILKACNETGFFRKLKDFEIDFKIHMLDIPSAWFAKGYQLLKDCPYVHFHSIKSPETGDFLPLADILNGRKADLIVASMVFHLIPRTAIPKLFRDFSKVLNKGGALIWNSPDIGPAGADSVLFHDPNRTLRNRALELIACPEKVEEILKTLFPAELAEYQSLKERLRRTRRDLTPEKAAVAASLAGRQILHANTNINFIEEELAPYFSGETFTRSFEILGEESLDTILVPSNQRYLAEIEDEDTRRKLIRLLMTHEIVPHLHNGLAGTAKGFSVHWAFGEHYLIGGEYETRRRA